MVIKMKYLEEYIRYLTYEKHYSSYTVVNYESDILEFIDYLNKEQIENRSFLVNKPIKR